MTTQLRQRDQTTKSEADSWAKAHGLDLGHGALSTSRPLRRPPHRAISRGAAYMHCYRNIGVPWCGQAAAASLLDYWGFDPFGLPRTVTDSIDGSSYWDQNQVVSAVHDRYPADFPFPPDDARKPTTPNQVQAALQGLSHPSIYSFVSYSGVDDMNGEQNWEVLKKRLTDDILAPPVILLDCRTLGWDSLWWTGHYVPAFNYDGSNVWVGNSIATGGVDQIPQDNFRAAWACHGYLGFFSHVIVDFWITQ